MTASKHKNEHDYSFRTQTHKPRSINASSALMQNYKVSFYITASEKKTQLTSTLATSGKMQNKT
jgi:hypothetical protein